MKVSVAHPEPHKRYIVRRGGVLFTATPCYGMHRPWWVVKLMVDEVGNLSAEAPPAAMHGDDEYFSIDVLNHLVDTFVLQGR